MRPRKLEQVEQRQNCLSLYSSVRQLDSKPSMEEEVKAVPIKRSEKREKFVSMPGLNMLKGFDGLYGNRQ